MDTLRDAVGQHARIVQPRKVSELREVVGHRLDVYDILVGGPQTEAVANQDGRVELFENLLLRDEFLGHEIAERGLAAVATDAEVEAAQSLILRWNKDEVIHGCKRRR